MQKAQKTYKGFYQVQKIIDKKVIIQGKVDIIYYKILWKGFPEEQCTWQPKENLKDLNQTIRMFELGFFRENLRASKEIQAPIYVSTQQDFIGVNTQQDIPEAIESCFLTETGQKFVLVRWTTPRGIRKTYLCNQQNFKCRYPELYHQFRKTEDYKIKYEEY